MQQTDIFIVDGGIAGTATAYYLALSGHQVTLLEQSELAGDCTGYLGHPFAKKAFENEGEVLCLFLLRLNVLNPS